LKSAKYSALFYKQMQKNVLKSFYNPSTMIAQQTQLTVTTMTNLICTDKEENQIFLIYKEIQNGAVAKSYMSHD
jgi:hypothetical protein